MTNQLLSTMERQQQTQDAQRYMGNASFKERMETLKSLCSGAGLRLPETIVPEGESLIPYGQDRKRALAADVASLPDFGAVRQAVHTAHQYARPKDINVPLSRVRMDPNNGGIYGKDVSTNAPTLGYTRSGFSQLASAVKPESVTSGFHATLLALPPSIRARAFNHFADVSAIKTPTSVLRTVVRQQWREGQLTDRRVLNAVVTPTYSAYEDTDLMSALHDAVPAGCKVRYTTTDDRTDIELIWPAMQRELLVGDIALISLAVTNSQNKASAIRISPRLLRVLCLNFTTAYTSGGDEEISIKHVGENLRPKFARAMRNALQTVEPFVRAFGDAYRDQFPQGQTRPEIIAKTVKRFELADSLGEQIAAKWDADGTKSAGNTRAGLVNAITRASQELTMDRAAKVESVAGKIIANGWNAIGI